MTILRHTVRGNLGPQKTGMILRTHMFSNDLQTGLTPTLALGDNTATYTRATEATEFDEVPKLNLIGSGEARFKGARRVENKMTASEDMTDGAYSTANGAVVDSATQITFDGTTNGNINEPTTIVDDGGGAGSRHFIFSCKVRLISGTITGDSAVQIRLDGNALTTVTVSIGSQVDSTSQRFVVTASTDAAGTAIQPKILCNDAITLELIEWMFEESTGRVDTTTPSEYVSSGVGTGPELNVDSNATSPSNEADDTVGITSAGTSTFESQSAVSDSGYGNYAVRWKANANIGRIYKDIQTDFDLVAGKDYTLLCRVRHDGVSVDNAVLRLANTNAANATLVSIGTVTQSDTTFQTITYTWTHSSDFAYFVFREDGGTDDAGGYISYLSIKEADHGANVDSVKYFDTNNGNTVASDIVTDTTGSKINLVNNPKHVELDGISGSYVSSPDSAAASVTGDITLIAYAALDDWSTGVSQDLICKYVATGSQKSWVFQSNNTGQLRLYISGNGSALVNNFSNAVVPFSDGEGGWVRATWSPDTDVVNFFTSQESKTTSPSSLTWEQLGDVDRTLVNTGIFDSTSPIEIGTQDSGTVGMLAGVVSRALVIASTDPTASPVVDFNASDHINGASTLTSSTTGEVYTLNGGATVPVKYYDAEGPFGYHSEASAENIVTWSNAFNSSDWSASNAVDSQNEGVFVDGTNTLQKITDDSSTGTGAVALVQNVTITGSVDWTFSVYIKKDQLNFAYLRTLSFDAATSGLTYFDLVNGVVGTQSANHSNATIEVLANDIFRCSITFQSVTDLAGSVRVAAAEADNQSTVDLDGTSSIFAGGAQLELGSFPTSYIPTTTVPVTRDPDVLTYDDVGNIEDAAGTSYCEGSTDWGTSDAVKSCVTRDSGGRMLFQASGQSDTQVRVYDSGIAASSGLGENMNNSAKKIASTWGIKLEVYSPGTLSPDPDDDNYDGTMGSGDIGVGCRNDGTLQWSGTIRRVKIYGKEFTQTQIDTFK